MKLLPITFILLLAFSAHAQKILTNQDIIELSKLGAKDDAIITSIKSSQTKFDTSERELTELKRNGISSLVIAAILKSPTSMYIEETPEIRKRISEITIESGRYFKQGLLNIQDNRRKESAGDFNNSVEVFLKSGMNIYTNEKIQSCYSQLIETIYRIEYPSVQQPQIKNLSNACFWDLDGRLADSVVAKLNQQTSQTTKSNETALIASAAGSGASAGVSQGFSEQKFEPSPLDDLAKVEPTVEAKESTSLPKNKKTFLSPGNEVAILGGKPTQAVDRKVPLVMKYFNDYFNDPYSMRFISWSNVVKVYLGNEPYWGVQVKFRAKNGFNAYILSEMIFYIQRNKVVTTKTLY